LTEIRRQFMDKQIANLRPKAVRYKLGGQRVWCAGVRLRLPPIAPSPWCVGCSIGRCRKTWFNSIHVQAFRHQAGKNPRDCFLSHEELTAFLRGLDAMGRDRWGNELPKFSNRIKLTIRLMLTTAQRLGEVRQAAWSEFDLEHEKVWTIPKERAENNLAHRVPLSAQALALLAEIKGQASNSDLLFRSPQKRKPISGEAIEAAMRRNEDALGLRDVTPHDLRRTAASHMTSIGITRLVVLKILNHALDAWGKRLEEIVSGKSTPSNVAQLQIG
jgi:integrase